jgi:hypothetical protein
MDWEFHLFYKEKSAKAESSPSKRAYLEVSTGGGGGASVDKYKPFLLKPLETKRFKPRGHVSSGKKEWKTSELRV